ncbi:MAG TPA: hypothetical protein VFO18_12155 [Methylomirabilota bacterium]|nr:hypothetical protein [Methylomirabilota bacterium]
MITRLILVTPRYDRECYALLAAKFVGDPVVTVIEDRRVAQRRKRAEMRVLDRRKGDRRGRIRTSLGTIVALRPLAPLSAG